MHAKFKKDTKLTSKGETMLFTEIFYFINSRKITMQNIYVKEILVRGTPNKINKNHEEKSTYKI